MRKKNIYALESYFDEHGAPCLLEKWSNYNDDEIEEKFHEIQLHVIARGFVERKPLPHFRKILFRFMKAIVIERREAKERKQ